MTKASREVLKDCKGALKDFKDGVQGNEWRRRWITSIVLLRTVGHVLSKVDALHNPLLSNIIDTEWKKLQDNKPEPRIFWEFIDKERNNILKEYQINAGQGITIRPGTLYLNLSTGKQTCEKSLSTLYHYRINSGYYKGKNQKDVLNEAIIWWDKYLTNIETQYKAKKT